MRSVIKKPPEDRAAQRVEKGVNLEKRAVLHAEETSRNRQSEPPEDRAAQIPIDQALFERLSASAAEICAFFSPTISYLNIGKTERSASMPGSAV